MIAPFAASDLADAACSVEAPSKHVQHPQAACVLGAHKLIAKDSQECRLGLNACSEFRIYDLVLKGERVQDFHLLFEFRIYYLWCKVWRSR